jgi:beta-lactamase regulating signal transducer with metallopeptidase domain
VDLLLHVGLSNALTATLLAVAVAAVARVCRRPALAHALWLLVLLKLVTPPLLPVSLPWTDPLAAEPTVPARAVPAALPGPGPDRFDVPPRLADRADEQAPVPAPGPGRAEALPAPPPREPAPAAVPPEWPGWKPVLLVLWLTGSALWWLIACLRVARFRRLLRHATPAPAEVQCRAEELAGRLGLTSCPGVWLVPARVSPLLWALGRAPRLLLPVALWQSLAPEQRDTLLAHELAHLRRHDHWVRRLELLVLGLFWWHPVAWWARHELAEAEEACCDAWVLWALPEAAPAYAAALVETLAYLSRARRPVPVAASGVGRVKNLKRRLFMILQRPSPRALSGAGLFAVLGLGGLLLPLLPTWAEQQAAERRADADPVPAAVEKQVADPPDPLGGGRNVPVPDPPPLAGEGKAVTVPAQEGPPRAETPAPHGLTEEIDRVRDEVELLEAQLEIKVAQLKAAQASLRYAEQRLARLAQQAGAVSVASLSQAEAEVAAHKAQVAIKEAELREPQVRLRQAARRLAALQARAGGAGSAREQSWPGSFFINNAPAPTLNVPHGGTAKYRFRVMNQTKERVHISAVRTSSAAVTATPSATEFQPGQKGFIDVIVDAGRFTGLKTFTVSVAFDQPRAAEAKLGLTVNATDTKERLIPSDTRVKGAEDRERLRELERKLDLLLKQVEELRQKISPTRPRGGQKGPGPNEGQILKIGQRNFKLPFQTAPDQRGRLHEVVLYISDDQGKSWQRLASQAPDTEFFNVTVPRDGLYWFNVATIDKSGRQEPEQIEKTFRQRPPILVVLVQGGG